MALVLFVLLLFGVPVALAEDPHFERVGTEAAPLPEVVTALYQDRSGLVWIGSREGLMMYDGHAFTSFVHDPSEPSTLSDNAIRTLYEDRIGNLWIGTNAGGLDRLDLATRTFRHYRSLPDDPSSLSYDSVYAVAEDGQGALWVGTQRGLNRLDPATGKFERFTAGVAGPGGLQSAYVGSLLVDRSGRVWVGTLGGGLARFDRGAGSFTTFRHANADPASLADDSVFALREAEGDGLWVGTSSGLDLMDQGTGRFRHFRHDPKNPATLSYPLITSITDGPPGTLWVGTYGGGVNELNVATGAFRVLGPRTPGPAGRGDDRVVALLTDRSGSLWIGTWGAGLARLRRSALVFASASAAVPVPAGLEDVEVQSLGRDARGGLWIGTGTGELLRFDATDRSFRRYPGDEHAPILEITESADGSIWIGTPSGLARLDPKSGQRRWLRHDPKDPGSLGPGYVKAVLEDREGRLWVGTGEGGLQRLDAQGRVLERIRPRPNDPSSLSDDYVTAIVEDRRGTLWVGTRSGGLNAFDPRTGRAVRYQPVLGRSDSLSHHTVISILEDSKGRLWIGTAGGGVNRLDEGRAGEPARFTRFTTANGLADNNVMAILEDDDGSLWLGTRRGLSRFDPKTETFANFLAADGLPSTEFAPDAAVRVGSTLYFGTVKWLAAVSASTPFPRSAPSPTVVTSIRGAAAELLGDKPAWRLEHVDVPYGEWLSLELAVLDYGSEATHAYAYRLGGADAAWVDLGGRHSITFTDLAPGTYAFVAKGRNDQGVWSETVKPLVLTVVPPFWMTLWFRAAGAAGLVAAAVLIHQVRTAALKRRHRELLELHTQRERARTDLNQAYDRLRLLARRLEVAKEQERKTIARELHDELGPTLTAVVINLQLLKDTPDPERRSRRIADTVEIVDRMVQRIRELSLDLRPPLLDEMGLIAALRGYLETLAARSGLVIEVRGDSAVEGLPPEVEIVAFRIVQEAVTNVLRHAGAKRAVVNVLRRDRKLEISVEDDGKGFDVASSMETAATGNALGLLGMQERVLMLAGQLEIVSRPGGGTVVRASLPAEAVA